VVTEPVGVPDDVQDHRPVQKTIQQGRCYLTVEVRCP